MLVLFALVTFGLAKRKGYFISIHSLRMRTLFDQARRTPFLVLTDLISRFRLGEILVTRFRGVVKAMLIGGVFSVSALIAFALIPEVRGIVVNQNLTSKLGTIWQVHATITGFSIIALVFVWEALQADVEASKLIGEMTEKQGLLDRIYFLIIANLFIGVGVFISSPLSSASTVAETPMLLLVIGWVSVVTVLAVLVFSAWELLKYYEDIHSFLFRKGPDQIAVEVYRQKLANEGERSQTPSYGDVIESELGIKLSPYISLFTRFGSDDVVRVAAEEIDANGKRTTDIDLSQLRTAVELLDEDAEVSLWYRLGERPRESTSILRADANLSDTERSTLVNQLRNSYKFQP